jgi:pyruvate/2-oxoglutarate/acetoin dehydrogenase E1 component
VVWLPERVVAVETYLQAITHALGQEMERDERVLLLGEDIGGFGGAFKVTDGLSDRFGADRVRDTPIAEAGIVGTAVGAAITGMRPVCEMQFADFVACGFDQIVNVAAKMHYRLGLAVPLTIRLPSGGGFSGGPFHSQNPEAWFMHAPGLKVFAPSSARDAAGLLCAAIRDPNPVIFMEHKFLYRRIKEEVPYEIEPIEPSAHVAREGDDLTVVTYGAMVHTALKAAEASEHSVEVLDLRTLVPLDVAAVLRSVEKTSRLLVVDEANGTCAAGAQVAAVVAEQGFESLDAPVRRLAVPDAPIPFSPALEAAMIPDGEAIGEAIDDLARY